MQKAQNGICYPSNQLLFLMFPGQGLRGAARRPPAAPDPAASIWRAACRTDAEHALNMRALNSAGRKPSQARALGTRP